MMRKIYEPENLLEGELLQSVLASEGIESHITGRHLLGAVGELPVFGLLGLAVDDAQAERARQLITEYNGAFPLSGDEPDNYPDVLLC
ncbi:putative signal transducing protein [Pseudomonas sp. LP_7_YM]|nr:putative signal transducing protein [Pseudomonas sp. LP_7_YM]